VPGSELCDISGNQLRDGAKWPHKAVDATILIVVHLFASSCRPNARNREDSRGSSFIPACRAGIDEQVVRAVSPRIGEGLDRKSGGIRIFSGGKSANAVRIRLA
jgi:hypothetical protein